MYSPFTVSKLFSILASGASGSHRFPHTRFTCTYYTTFEFITASSHQVKVWNLARDSYREATELCPKALETTFGLALRSNIGLAEVFLKLNRVEVDSSTLFFALVQ